MSFTVIDWIFSGLILILAFSGLIKGFVNSILGKLALILGILFACLFYDKVSAKVFHGINNVTLQNVLSFLLIFVVVFLIIKIFQELISKVFTWQPLKSLDKTLGFVFGIVEGLAVVWLILFLLQVQPFFSAEPLTDGSFYKNMISSLLKTGNTGIYVKEVLSNV